MWDLRIAGMVNSGPVEKMVQYPGENVVVLVR